MKRYNLSDQAAQALKERIVAGRYAPHTLLPSITDLAADLAVGRSTVREALKRLEAEGLVVIQHGKGVTVAEPKVDFTSRVVSFTNAIRALGMRPGAVVLQKEVIPATPIVREKLQLPEGGRVNHLVRLRLADDLPMALEDSFSPAQDFPGLIERPDLDGSLYEILATVYSCEIAYAVRIVEAVLTRPEENRLFGLHGPQAGLLIETVALDRHHKPVEYGKSLYRADRYKFIVQQTA